MDLLIRALIDLAYNDSELMNLISCTKLHCYPINMQVLKPIYRLPMPGDSYWKRCGVSANPGFLLGIFSGGGQNLLLCYCFRTKFQGGAKVFRGANCLRGSPPRSPPPRGRKPESNLSN